MKLFPIGLCALLAALCAPTSAQEADKSKDKGEPDPSPADKTFTFKQTKERELKIHIHLPDDWKETDRRAAIVFFFGGGWNSRNVPQFTVQAEYLASRGMVAARADYRVKITDAVLPGECVEDAKSAIRWVRGHATELGIDPERIVASGGSAGGHLAAATALVDGFEAAGEDHSISSAPSALVLFNPALSFLGSESMLERLGGDADLARRISPTEYITATTQPAILFFGSDDRLLAHGEEYIEKSKKAGNRAELDITEGQGHGFFNRSPHTEKTLRAADRFLESIGYLEGEPEIEIPQRAEKRDS